MLKLLKNLAKERNIPQNEIDFGHLAIEVNENRPYPIPNRRKRKSRICPNLVIKVNQKSKNQEIISAQLMNISLIISQQAKIMGPLNCKSSES